MRSYTELSQLELDVLRIAQSQGFIIHPNGTVLKLTEQGKAIVDGYLQAKEAN